MFTALAYGSLFFITWNIGTESGLLFYYPVAAVIVVLVLGSERIVLAGILAAVERADGDRPEATAPADTGLQPAWSMTVGFILSISASALMAFAAVWFALRETARAEVAMEMEYERSNTLTDILPASTAARLKGSRPRHDRRPLRRRLDPVRRHRRLHRTGQRDRAV